MGELFRIKHGYAFKGEYFADEGPYIVMTPGNFYDQGGFRSKGDKEKRYTGAFPGEYLLNKGDLLVAMTEQAVGLLGSAAVVPEDNLYLHNQRLGLVTDLSNDADKSYLYYLFNSQDIRDQIQASANGAKVRHTSPGRILAIQAAIPPLLVQLQVAGVLSAYDDLIENNTRRIAILEEMARALYREWFVEFRFPGRGTSGSCQDPSGRSLPRAWSIKKLDEIADIVMGQSPKSEFYNDRAEGLPFHQGVTNFGKRFPRHRVYCTELQRVAEPRDVLVSVRAPVGRLNIADTQLVLGRGLCAVRARPGWQTFVFEQLRVIFKEEDSMGSGTIFKAVTKADMTGIEMVVPPDDLVHHFEQTVGPMAAEVQVLDRMNANLQRTRDLLLPKLISGEIDVSELDIDVGEPAA